MPKQQGFTKIEQEEIKEQANSFWDDSTEMMNPLFSLINDAERMWRVQLPEELEDAFREHPDRASLAPPDFYINLKSIRAGLNPVNPVFVAKVLPKLNGYYRVCLICSQMVRVLNMKQIRLFIRLYMVEYPVVLFIGLKTGKKHR